MSSLLICPQVSRTETLPRARCEHWGKKRKRHQCFMSRKETPQLTDTSGGLDIVSSTLIPTGYDGAAEPDALQQSYVGKKARTISYEMCLSQLISNKCMILREQYLLTESMLWRPNYIFQWTRKVNAFLKHFYYSTRNPIS